MPTSLSRLCSVALISAFGLIGGTVTATTPTSTAPPAALVAPAPATAVALSASTSSTAFEEQVVALVNKARSTKRKCGATTYAKAKPVKWNAKLALAAEAHSTDMALRNYFSHTSKSGKSPAARIKAAGYKHKAMGETLAAGYGTPEAVVKAWLKSPAHCRILMSKTYTQVGVGYYSGAGKYVNYTTANFAKPK